jgi:hypothetical protein
MAKRIEGLAITKAAVTHAPGATFVLTTKDGEVAALPARAESNGHEGNGHALVPARVEPAP